MLLKIKMSPQITKALYCLVLIGTWLGGIFILNTLNYFPSVPFDKMIPNSIVMLLFGIYFFYYLIWGKESKNNDKVGELFVTTFALMVSWSLTYIFRNTDFGLHGLNADATHYVVSVNKYKFFHWYTDPFYKDLAPSYPPVLFFYILGKFASLFDLPAYSMLKWGFIISSFALPLLLYRMWRQLCSVTATILIVFFCMYDVLNEEFLFRTFSAWSSLLIFPWWGKYLKRNDSYSKRRFTHYVIGGLIGAVIFQNYYSFVLVFVVSYFIEILMFKNGNSWAKVWNSYKDSFFVYLSTAIFSAGQWLPQMIDIFKYPTKQLSSRYFFVEMMGPLSLLKEGMGPLEVFKILGLIGLFVYANKSELLKRLQVILGGIFTWQILGHVLTYLDKPIGHIRSEIILSLLLLISCAISISIFYEEFKAKSKTHFKFIGVLVCCSFLIVSIFERLYYGIDKYGIKDYPEFKASTDVVSIQNDEQLVNEIKGKVFFHNGDFLGVYLPVYFFNNSSPYEANMNGQFDDRYRFLKLLLSQNSAKLTNWMFLYNKFDRVDYIKLDSDVLSFAVDNFPNGRKNIQFQFNIKTFIASPFYIPIKGYYHFYKVKDVPMESVLSFSYNELKLIYLFANKRAQKLISSKFPEIKKMYDKSGIGLEKNIKKTTFEFDQWLSQTYRDFQINSILPKEYPKGFFYGQELKSTIEADRLTGGELFAMAGKHSKGLMTFGPNFPITNSHYEVTVEYKSNCIKQECSYFSLTLWDKKKRKQETILRNILLDHTAGKTKILKRNIDLSSYTNDLELEILTYFSGKGDISLKSVMFKQRPNMKKELR